MRATKSACTPRLNLKAKGSLMSQFKLIPYAKLNARQKEQFNFQKVAATLADYGFNCIKLADDWHGADFLAHHVEGSISLRVQLKARLTIQKKYVGKGIWIAFPHKGFWYLVEHDRLVDKVRDNTDWLQTESWKRGNGYSSSSINRKLLNVLAEDKLDSNFRPLA